MGKALMVSVQTAVFTNGTTWSPLFGLLAQHSAEVQSTVQATEGATFSNLRVNILSGGSGTNNFQFRDTGANGNLLATRAGTGVAEDLVNTDVLTAGDTFNVAYTDTGTNSEAAWLTANVEFASGHGCFHGSARNVAVWDLPSTTSFGPINGYFTADGTATEADTQWKNRGYTSIAALQARVTANARASTSNFRSRINAGFGNLQVDFGAGVTGLIVDTDSPDTIASGDLINFSLTTNDAGVDDLTVAFVGATLKSSTNKSEVVSAAEDGYPRAASATPEYFTIGGQLNGSAPTTPTDANQRIKVGFAATCSNLRCYLSANTYSGDGTLKLYKNGTAVLTTTLTASGGAGWYENSTDTVDIDDDDELSYEINEGTSGSITVTAIGITFSQTGSPISMSGESSNTFSSASIAEAPITSAGDSVNTLAGASIAEAPITSTGESVATFSGESDVPAEGRISATAESIATLAGASLADGAITSTAESIATLDGASLAAGAISVIGESLATLEGASTSAGVGDMSADGVSLMTMFGEAVSDEGYDPAWIYGTSKAALKNPWKKKRKKGPDDDEFMALFNYALSVTKSRPPQ